MVMMGRSLGPVLACLLCVGLLLLCVAIRSGEAKAMPLAAEKTLGKNLDPFNSSKRRVPNGPDPIHNRRAGKSGRPPGRA